MSLEALLPPPQATQQPPADDDSGKGDIRLGLVLLAVFFLGFGGWAAFAPLDAAVVAPAVVVVSGNRQTIQHREGGMVSRLAVREGDEVERGQVLIELGAPELVAQDQALLSQVLDLQVQRQRLAAERSGAARLTRPPEWINLAPEDREAADAAFARHQREMGRGGAAAWSAYDARIAGYRDEIGAINRQEALMQEELVGMRELAAEQLVPLTRIRALERGVAELQGRRAELNAAIATTQQERTSEQRDIDARLAELVPQLVGVRERLEQTRMRAPADGVVVGLSVHTVGGVIQPGERVMDIVPRNQELIVEAQVRPEDADDLAPGQRTEVRITAFGGRNLPIVFGEVEQVSADRFTDERTGLPYFRAQIAVPPEELQRLVDAGNRELRPGLSAQVVVPTRKRTALQYLLEPLDQAVWRSMREQ